MAVWLEFGNGFYWTLYNGCNHLFILALQLIPASKWGQYGFQPPILTSDDIQDMFSKLKNLMEH